ncbi:Zinc resistance conferring protein [Coemansia sp. RSA 1646]|nr:Zinc resistance conferring protein [Coemansia sp. RSA 1646]
MLALSATMFFAELVVGIVAGSITLVADSFHMLNDVLGMVIALWAIKMAGSDKEVPNNTYGWQRAEILGALTNGVLLLGLCLTIYIDAIERFISIKEVKTPMLVTIVGCVGLAFNLMGLLLFHEHAHGHSHAHSHSHSHSHDEEESIADEEDALISARDAAANAQTGYATIEMPPSAASASSSHAAYLQQNSSAVDNRSIIGVPHPVYTHQAIIKSAQQMQDGTAGEDDSAAVSSAEASIQSSPRVVSQGYNSSYASHNHQQQMHGDAISSTPKHRHSHQHQKNKSKKKKKHGHGTSGHLNMQGVWLHIFGDCITNIAVIISGLVIWKAEGHWRYYFDPAISVLINTLIVWITVPLVKSASFILLNGVPSNVDLNDLRRDLRAIPNVLNIHDLHVWQLSDTKNVASVHVLIDRPPSHQCIHNSNASSDANLSTHAHSAIDNGEHQIPQVSTRATRLVSRNGRPTSLHHPGAVDMDCLYMDVALQVKQVMHGYGIHSTTIQPEFVVGQPVSVATKKRTASDATSTETVTAADSPNAHTDESTNAEDEGHAHAGREGSIFSRVAIVPDSTEPEDRANDSSATIGPCLLVCNNSRGCLPSSCCPGETPIKVAAPGNNDDSPRDNDGND